MADISALHAVVEDFVVRDGCLCVGGDKVTDIAAELDTSPFYLYDAHLIGKRIEHLRASLPDRVSLHYAIKANPMQEVVDLISRQVDGLDVASAAELRTALQTGCAPSHISFAGPGKTVKELAAAIQAGITLNVESETELERIATIAGESGRRPAVAVRVNPDFELKSSGMKMSGGPKQFGIDAERVPAVLRRMADLPVDFAGFHIFSGSQNLRSEAICESQTKSLALALELAPHAPREPRWINIGGGFGIPYFPGDSVLDLNPIGQNLARLLPILDDAFSGTELILELGRYIVGEAGLYICKVLDRKVSRGQIFLITDGGLHHHLAASGNFGQVIRKNYPVAIANRIGSDDMETASVVGPLCTPLDVLADRMQLSSAQIGDLVAVFQSGAYGLTASPHKFLSHPEPREFLR